MINQFRTLLANLPAGDLTADGEEYVDPSFVPAALPTYLAKVRGVLFGGTPDRRAALYRVRQYVAMVHSTPLEEFAFADDPRVTYLPLARGVFEMRPGLAVTPAGGRGYQLYLAGTDGGPASSRWLVRWDGTHLVVIPGSGVAVPNTPDFSGGLSTPVTLPGSALTASVEPGMPPGTAWYVSYSATPAQDPGVVAANLKSVGVAEVVALFGAFPAEPYLTWKNLWQSTMPLPYRLGAVALAVAKRTGGG